MSKDTKIQPINRQQYGLAAHRYNMWDAEVPASLGKDDLANEMLWVNMAPNIRTGDEIRVRADDGSFVAQLYVSFKYGNKVTTQVLWMTKVKQAEGVENLDTDRIGDFTIKQRGQQGWCLMQVSTGDVIKSNLGNKSDALRELEQHARAIAA